MTQKAFCKVRGFSRVKQVAWTTLQTGGGDGNSWQIIDINSNTYWEKQMLKTWTNKTWRAAKNLPWIFPLRACCSHQGRYIVICMQPDSNMCSTWIAAAAFCLLICPVSGSGPLQLRLSWQEEGDVFLLNFAAEHTHPEMAFFCSERASLRSDVVVAGRISAAHRLESWPSTYSPRGWQSGRGFAFLTLHCSAQFSVWEHHRTTSLRGLVSPL